MLEQELTLPSDAVRKLEPQRPQAAQPSPGAPRVPRRKHGEPRQHGACDPCGEPAGPGSGHAVGILQHRVTDDLGGDEQVRYDTSEEVGTAADAQASRLPRIQGPLRHQVGHAGNA